MTNNEVMHNEKNLFRQIDNQLDINSNKIKELNGSVEFLYLPSGDICEHLVPETTYIINQDSQAVENDIFYKINNEKMNTSSKLNINEQLANSKSIHNIDKNRRFNPFNSDCPSSVPSLLSYASLEFESDSHMDEKIINNVDKTYMKMKKQTLMESTSSIQNYSQNNNNPINNPNKQLAINILKRVEGLQEDLNKEKEESLEKKKLLLQEKNKNYDLERQIVTLKAQLTQLDNDFDFLKQHNFINNHNNENTTKMIHELTEKYEMLEKENAKNLVALEKKAKLNEIFKPNEKKGVLQDFHQVHDSNPISSREHGPKDSKFEKNLEKKVFKLDEDKEYRRKINEISYEWQTRLKELIDPFLSSTIKQEVEKLLNELNIIVEKAADVKSLSNQVYEEKLSAFIDKVARKNLRIEKLRQIISKQAENEQELQAFIKQNEESQVKSKRVDEADSKKICQDISAHNNQFKLNQKKILPNSRSTKELLKKQQRLTSPTMKTNAIRRNVNLSDKKSTSLKKKDTIHVKINTPSILPLSTWTKYSEHLKNNQDSSPSLMSYRTKSSRQSNASSMRPTAASLAKKINADEYMANMTRKLTLKEKVQRYKSEKKKSEGSTSHPWL